MLNAAIKHAIVMSLEPPPMTRKGFEDRVSVSRETVERLQTHLDQLHKWQRAVNLVSAATLEDPWRRHIWDSFQLIDLLPGTAKTIVDIGSGAGFPGLVLAAAGRHHVTLVESDMRKCIFLQEAVRAMGLDVDIHNSRVEEVRPFAADVVTARAVGPLTVILEYAAPFLQHGGVGLFPKGVRADEEVEAARKSGWSFDVILHKSLTEPAAAILDIRDVRSFS